MNDEPGSTGSTSERRSRRATRTLSTTEERAPQPGNRFPSAVFGDNLRALRELRRLHQDDLAQTMKYLGFAGWSRVTVSDVERGVRITGVDELFALAIALGTHVVTLLDPYLSGDKDAEIDLGIPLPSDLKAAFARSFILSEKDPWQRDRWPRSSYGEYRKQFAKIPAILKKRAKREKTAEREKRMDTDR